MRLFLLIASAASLTVACSIAYAADFFLAATECKVVLAPVFTAESDAIKFVTGDRFGAECTRQSRRIDCVYTFLDGQKTNRTYSVDMDTPPLIVFTDEKYSDYVAVDEKEHEFVSLSRYFGRRKDGRLILGTKICKGLFGTEYELDTLQKQRR